MIDEETTPPQEEPAEDATEFGQPLGEIPGAETPEGEDEDRPLPVEEA